MSNEVIHGWIEMLYRRDVDPPSKMAEINPEDYIAVSSKLPLSEFDNMYDVVEFFSRENPDVIRTIKEFDVINIFKFSPDLASNTFVAVSKKNFKKFIRQDCTFHEHDDFDLVLIPVFVQQRFNSFLQQNNE
jgi:hypothetical protein